MEDKLVLVEEGFVRGVGGSGQDDLVVGGGELEVPDVKLSHVGIHMEGVIEHF